MPDESRRYRDRDGVVHRSSDLTGVMPEGNRITFCERYDTAVDGDTYDSRELIPTGDAATCVRCVTLPLRVPWTVP